MHQKRMSMPKSWKVPKKNNKWITSTIPGTHSKNSSLPLIVVIRDLLKIGNTLRECKKILIEGNILIDGIIRKNLKFPVGLFDVISIPNNDEYYRMIQDKKGRLYLKKISLEESKWKLCKIKNKVVVSSSIIQLNLSDGTNIITKDSIYKTKDTLKISLPDKKIIQRFEYKVGTLSMIIGGSHNGEIGIISKITKIKSSKNNTVSIVMKNNVEFETIESYVFVIGEENPEINS